MRKPAIVAALLTGLVLQGCGSSEAPEAYPGRPVDPPRQDDSLLEMIAGGPTTPATAEATAEPTAAPSASAAPTASATVAASASATAGPKTPPKPKPQPKK